MTTSFTARASLFSLRKPTENHELFTALSQEGHALPCAPQAKGNNVVSTDADRQDRQDRHTAMSRQEGDAFAALNTHELAHDLQIDGHVARVDVRSAREQRDGSNGSDVDGVHDHTHGVSHVHGHRGLKDSSLAAPGRHGDSRGGRHNSREITHDNNGGSHGQTWHHDRGGHDVDVDMMQGMMYAAKHGSHKKVLRLSVCPCSNAVFFYFISIM
jgi:hypothetical protein